MPSDDCKMTGIGEAESPTAPDNEGKNEPVEKAEVDTSQNKDFGLVKQCKSK